uniref:Uncharacterized protein n=1 Tax=Romanomermis culicivorax TaxID=13658 RepID=A0A915IXT1_ROMCU
MVRTLDKEVALMTTEIINRIYDEAGLEIEAIRYYELQFHMLQANLPEKLWHIFELQIAEWTTTQPPRKAYEAAVWACTCLFMKLSRLGRIPQNFVGFHYQAHAYVAMKLGLWKKETNNTNPRIRFWEVIDQKKAHDILEVEKSLKKKVGYRVKHAHNRPAASRVSKRWTKQDSDVRRKEKSQTPDKERKQKHESRHRDESCHEKSMSRGKKRRENDEESRPKEIENLRKKAER